MDNSTKIVNDKFGYVENVPEECQYTNVDYRDTTVPLWHELYHKVLKQNKDNDYARKNPDSRFARHSTPHQKEHQEQNEINLALCAATIQLGKSMHSSFDCIYNKIKNIEDQIAIIRNNLDKLSVALINDATIDRL